MKMDDHIEKIKRAYFLKIFLAGCNFSELASNLQSYVIVYAVLGGQSYSSKEEMMQKLRESLEFYHSTFPETREFEPGLGRDTRDVLVRTALRHETEMPGDIVVSWSLETYDEIRSYLEPLGLWGVL